MKTLRERVKKALERMEAANKALNEAGEDADLDALNTEFDEAEAEHRTAVTALERQRKTEEARQNLPVDPTDENDEDDEDDDDGILDLDPDNEPERKRRSKKDPARPRKRGNVTYQRGKNNIFNDMAQARFAGNPKAAERLAQHSKEMEVEMRAHPNQAAGEGGEFIPPLWLQDEWLSVARPGRAFADSLNPKPLPAGTNQINIPRLASGASVAVQTDGGAVSSTDVTTGSVSGQLQTIAGQEDVSYQLHELSQPAIETVIMEDITGAYDQALDAAVLNGTVANAKGVLQLSGTNAVTFTQATPTLPLLYPKVADAVQRIATARFKPAQLIAMAPRRWGFALASLDTGNRPLIVPTAPMNPMGVIENVAAEAVVGSMQGLPVLIDANIPTTEGTGTNQDSIIVYRPDDIYLWEDPEPRFRVMEEVLSGTLQVRFQLVGFYILIAGRFPAAISKIQGTGLVTPAF